MPVAWRQLRIPGPPPALALNEAERNAQTADGAFARRSIQRLEVHQSAAAPEPAADAQGGERLALIDKASPHAQFDLMLALVVPRHAGPTAKPDPASVLPTTGQVLWQTAANFQRFIQSDEAQCQLDDAAHGGRDQARAALADAGSGPRAATERAEATSAARTGWLQVAMNCDPNTHDRESVQALKTFHLHLIHWQPAELKALARADRVCAQRDAYLGRQCIDPLSFIGARLLTERLADLDLAALDASLLPVDAAATCAGRRPLGCLIQLPSWSRLATPAFEQLIRCVHQRLDETAAALLYALTGAEQAPAPWQRHQLLAQRRIAHNLTRLDLSAESRDGLLALTQRLHNLHAPVLRRLSQVSPARRMHCMTLSQPCYSLSLSPMDACGRSTMGQDGPLLLSLQAKLFSGIGGAGLISLPGIPSVRVLRGQGRFSDADWQRRANFQRRFAAYNTQAFMAQAERQSGAAGKPAAGSAGRPMSRGSERASDELAPERSEASSHRTLSCGPIGRFLPATGWTR